jgi:hypothetical protein
MQQIRRTLRTLLTSVAVLALLAASPLGTHASPAPQSEPISPVSAPPGGGDPSTGEPDVGDHRPLSAPTTQRSTPAEQAHFGGSTVRMVGWSTIVWLRAYFGISW